MKGKLRRIVAMMLLVVMCLTTLISCGSDNKDQSIGSVDYLTRGQWVTMLGQRFGMVNYMNNEPYYTDVASDSEIFPYVQSCFEWGILSTGTDTFKPDEIATTGFVISTSVLATGIDYREYMEGDDPNEGILGLANAKGITSIKYGEDKKLTEGLCLVEAAVILNSAVTCYLSEDNSEDDHIIVEYREDVLDKTDSENVTVNEDASQITMPASEAADIDTGEVFLVPSEQYPEGYAVKAVSKTVEADGACTIKVERPEIYEVLDEIDIDTYAIADSEHFVPVEGVTIVKDSAKANSAQLTAKADMSHISDLSGTDHKIDNTVEASASGSKTITLNINLTDGSSELTQDTSLDAKLSKMGTYFDEFKFSGKHSKTNNDDYDDFIKTAEGSRVAFSNDRAYLDKMGELADQYNAGQISEEEFCSQLETYRQQITENAKPVYKYKAGYSLTGQVQLELGVAAEAKIDFDWGNTTVEKFSLSLNSKTTSNVTLKGKIGGDAKLGELKIPINGGFVITVEVSLFVEANGEISYNFEVTSATKMEYENANGFKSTCDKSAKQSIDAKLSLEAGARLTACLTFIDIDIIDVALAASGKLEATASFYIEDGANIDHTAEQITIYEEIGLKTDVNLYLPIIKLQVGKKDNTVINELCLSAEFTLISQDQAEKIKLYDTQSAVRAEEVIPLKQEETTSGDGEKQPQGGLYIDRYLIIVDVGNSAVIECTLPDGYKESDLVWSSEKANIATVSGGIVTGISEGSSLVTVKTSDGKFTATCTVIVNK